MAKRHDESELYKNCIETTTEMQKGENGVEIPKEQMRTEEQVKLAISSILDNKYLNRNYKDEVVDILAWVLGGDMFDGLEGKSWDELNNEKTEATNERK